MWSFSINFYVLIVGLNKIVASVSKECPLPAHPYFGKLTLLNNPEANATHAPHLTIIQLTCQDNYPIEGSSVVVCLDGQWTPSIGKCLKTCSTIVSTPIRQITCKFDSKNLENCNEPRDGTVAIVKCHESYEDTRLKKTDLVCKNGKWSQRVPECEPTCGKIQHDETKLEFPWMAVLYKSQEKVSFCQATLISAKIVVAAAHCVTTPTGQLIPAKNQLVAVGKRYPWLGHGQDKQYEQQSQVIQIFIPKSFRGVANYQKGDIAVLVTQNPFVFNNKVQPICIDWTGRVNQKVSSNEQILLYVSTWSYWQDVTEVIHFPVPRHTDCEKVIPDGYKNYLSSDKFCAEAESSGVTLKHSDGGAGAYIKIDEKFYLAGVVSHKPPSNTTFVLYTRVANYSDELILRNLVTSKAEDIIEENPLPVASWEIPDLISCQLPERIKKGYWYLDEPPNVKVLKYVTSNSQIRLRCPQNYTVRGYETNVCKDGRWIFPFGKCDRQCPHLEEDEIRKVTCKDKNGRIVDCKESWDEVIARFTCQKMYDFDVLNPRPLICLSGKWSENVPECVKS